MQTGEKKTINVSSNHLSFSLSFFLRKFPVSLGNTCSSLTPLAKVWCLRTNLFPPSCWTMRAWWCWEFHTVGRGRSLRSVKAGVDILGPTPLGTHSEVVRRT